MEIATFTLVLLLVLREGIKVFQGAWKVCMAKPSGKKAEEVPKQAIASKPRSTEIPYRPSFQEASDEYEKEYAELMRGQQQEG